MIKTSGLVGKSFTLPGSSVPQVKCSGCGCSFPATSTHVSLSAACDDARYERDLSRSS
jgi:hypothetical protein